LSFNWYSKYIVFRIVSLDKKQHFWYSIGMKPRTLTTQLEKAIENREKKVIFLWGARQTGKSTILKFLFQKYGGSFFNFENLDDQRLFTPSLKNLEANIALKEGDKKGRCVFIDEIQKYPESTQSTKLLTDETDHIVIATGSSEMRAKTNQFDTLAGRYREYVLFPLSPDEIVNFAKEKAPRESFLTDLMIYGGYPGVALATNKIEELKNITQNSVVKDIVDIYELKNIDLVYNLLRLLAMQIGNLINVSELASSLNTTKITIDNYLTILSKNRVIYFLEPFRSNKRRAYLSRKKVYFLDLGIRNALIDDFRPIDVRQDLGAIFENLITIGSLRKVFYQRNNNRLYYYREIGGAQKEIDLIIETPEGKKTGHEIKFNGGKINKFPELGIGGYKVVSQENAVNFLT